MRGERDSNTGKERKDGVCEERERGRIELKGLKGKLNVRRRESENGVRSKKRGGEIERNILDRKREQRWVMGKEKREW